MEEKSAKLIYKLIFWFVLIVAVLLLFVHWKYSLCAVGVLLWNDVVGRGVWSDRSHRLFCSTEKISADERQHA